MVDQNRYSSHPHRNMTDKASHSGILSPDGQRLIFADVPDIVNIYQQGQYSSDIAQLSLNSIQEIAYPSSEKRPPIKELLDMIEKDPMSNKCLALKALRSVQSFGNYTHPKKEIENFINGNIKTLQGNFKQALHKLISSVILYGTGIAEITFSSKVLGYTGQWRLWKINVLNPERIQKFGGKRGKVEYIEYDNGDGKITKIPYQKCIHIINNAGTAFDESALWGIGDGIGALPYYKLKKLVLTQLSLATKNNATGLIHAKVPNNGKTVLVDSKMKPLKDSSGKPIEVTKQIAINYILQDLHKKDYVVTDIDVEINRLQIKNDERFWEYVLGYIDRMIQQAFAIPVGIFDSGMSGIQNVGLSQNYKSIFDATTFALTTMLKEAVINKIVKKLLYFNFPQNWFLDNYGEFIFDVEEDQDTINSRLSTISSLIASGILDANDIEVHSLIRKNLGLPALTQKEKDNRIDKSLKSQIQEEVQAQLQIAQMEMQLQQTINPPQPDPNQQGQQSAEGDYPE